jgi:outer membrane protein assembly factor BamB
MAVTRDGLEGWTVSFDGITRKVVLPLVLSGDGGAVLVVAGKELHALDTADGSTRWSHRVGRSIEIQPVIVGGRVLLPVPGTNNVRRLDLTDGTEIKPDGVLPGVPDGPLCPVGDSGEIFVFPDVSGFVHKVGGEGWKFPDTDEGLPVHGVQVIGDRIWVSLRGGKAHMLDLFSGDELWEWKQDLQDGQEEYGELGPVVLSDGTLYLGTSKGFGLALDADEGDELWHLKLPKLEEKVPSVKGTPCMAQGHLFFGCADGRVFVTVP